MTILLEAMGPASSCKVPRRASRSRTTASAPMLSGTAALPNQGSGVYVANSTATISGNQIAGNGYDGITVQGNGAPNGLSGLWTADGTTFDGEFDTDGTLLGGATYAPGISGQAFSFDGVSGAFEDNSDLYAALRPDPCTLSARRWRPGSTPQRRAARS